MTWSRHPSTDEVSLRKKGSSRLMCWSSLSLFLRSLAGYERAISCRTSRLRTCFMLRGLCQEGLLGESFCAGCRRSCTASATDQKNHSPCCTGHFQFMLFHRAYSRPKLKICKNLLRLSEIDGYVMVNLTVVAIPSILSCDEMRTQVLRMMWTLVLFCSTISNIDWDSIDLGHGHAWLFSQWWWPRAHEPSQICNAELFSFILRASLFDGRF